MLEQRPGQVRVLLADDHPIVRTGTRFVLEQDSRLRVIGEASRGREAIRMVTNLVPDVVLMDINLPDMSGLDVTRQITRDLPRVRVLILSLYNDSEYVLGSLEAGASGFLVKYCDPMDLRDGVLRAHAGERVIHQSVLHAVINRAVHGVGALSADALSAREREVLEYLAEGATSKEIALVLGLRPKTVENHRARILDKLGAANSAAAVRAAIARGLITTSNGKHSSLRQELA